MTKVKDGDKFRLRIGSRASIIVEVVVTPRAIKQGLSGRDKLPSGYGMLFIFPIISKQGMWMPDMKFPLDIIWLDENFKIVSITKNCKPCKSRDNCPNYSSTYSVKYAIEMTAGNADAYGFHVGTTLHVV